MSERSIEVISIHFNVPSHYLLLSEFIETANDVEQILQEFNFKFFDAKLNIQILVLPPEEGSFLKKLGIFFALPVCVLSWGFLESDIGKAYIKGLTGNEPAYWAEIAGEGTAKELIILKESVKGFLEKNNNTLEQAGIKINEFPFAYKARNNFYNMCLKSEEISGVEFNNSGCFDIKRVNFPNYFTKEIDKPDGKKSKSVFRLHRLVIVAPVISGGSSAQWKTRDAKTLNPLNFFLKDEDFYDGILSGKYPLKETGNDDIITVCIEYKIHEENGQEKVYERSAIKVYQFNNIKIAEIPTDLELMAFKESKHFEDKEKENRNENQPSLF
ncbi:MAG: hypothetical protein WC843_06090 [Candidatus Gracilibacteria bacterium]|jgi:hypothetical protein